MTHFALILCFVAPCAPQNLSVLMDCGSDSITLKWEIAFGALYYIATATDELGTNYTCNSVETHCQITGLRCGATYSAFVIASNIKCNSSISNTIITETGTTHTHTDVPQCNRLDAPSLNSCPISQLPVPLGMYKPLWTVRQTRRW